MSRTLFYLPLLLLANLYNQCAGSVATVELDEFTFDKVINKFDASLIKFDVAFPYGEKHEAYTTLARDAKLVDSLLVGEVGVKDYGERDNEGLARKYGLSKESFPAVKLFLKGKSEPVTFTYDDVDFTTDELRKFVKKYSGIHLSLPGCVPELDQLAIEFIQPSTTEEERQKLIKKVETVITSLESKVSSSGKVYVIIMKKVIEKGSNFIKTEIERITKLKTGKVSAEKKKELELKLNILQTFVIPASIGEQKSEL